MLTHLGLLYDTSGPTDGVSELPHNNNIVCKVEARITGIQAAGCGIQNKEVGASSGEYYAARAWPNILSLHGLQIPWLTA